MTTSTSTRAAAVVATDLRRPNPPQIDPLSPERVSSTLEPIIRSLISASGAKHSNHSLEISFHYDSPCDVRVSQVIEDKQSVTLNCSNGALVLAYPCMKEEPTQFQLERNVKQAMALIAKEQKIGWEQLNARGQGWFQIQVFIGDFRVTGLRTTMNIQVRKQ